MPIEQDETEQLRRQRILELEANRGERAALETTYGQVWDTDQLQKDFEVVGFAAPFIVVKRKSDGTKGSLEFQAHPRYYFNWKEYTEN